MIGMQYKVTLPSDYNMEVIRNRVKENGWKTDGFKGLLFKCYLVQEKDKDSFENVYAPFYIWKESEGMNRFIFDGFYDNIIKSFGWQNINIGVPLMVDLKDTFHEARFVIEKTGDITPSFSFEQFKENMKELSNKQKNDVGMVCIYNPDKWKYSQFYFYKERPCQEAQNIYQILHISYNKM